MNLLHSFKDDLYKLTYPRLVYEISQLGLKNIPCYPIPKGFKILRARSIENDVFNNTSQLSYNPWPKDFGRLSSPCFPIFYGSSDIAENDYPMITNIAELKEFTNNCSEDYYEKEIAIATFEVLDSFRACALIFSPQCIEKNKCFTPLVEKTRIESCSLRNNDFEILTEISNMCALPYKNKDFDYRITAAISNYIFYSNSLFEAIIYPSVELAYEGINIAIIPEAVDRKLKCKKISIKKIYRKGKTIVVDNISETEQIKENGSFELIEIEDKSVHLGREKALERLNDDINNN